MSENQTFSVKLYGNTSEPTTGEMHLIVWTPREAQARARKKVFKIVGTFLCCAPVCLFVHVLFIPVVLLSVATFVGSFPLYMYWSEELLTCVDAQGTCPYTKSMEKFGPYPTGRYKDPMTIQCRGCGQTLQAFAKALDAVAR
jgi:hypothetical protein